MGMIAKSMKTIGGMMKGKTEYDAAIVRQEAAMIARYGGETLTNLFPKGSTDHPSEATAAIWTDWERFEAIAMDLSRYATVLSDGADNERGSAGGSGDANLATMSPDDLFKNIGGTCSSCHQDFRQKKE